MHSLVGVLLSRNIRAQQVAAAAIADICTAAPRMQEAFLAVRLLTPQPTSLLDCPLSRRFWRGAIFEYEHGSVCEHSWRDRSLTKEDAQRHQERHFSLSSMLHAPLPPMTFGPGGLLAMVRASRGERCCATAEVGGAVQLVNERGAMDIRACMQHRGSATRTLITVDTSTRRHIGYAIIAKCSASAQAISGASLAPNKAVRRIVPHLRQGI